MNSLERKIKDLNDDLEVYEIKIQEQEIHITEQFEIIQDYSNDIEELNINQEL